MTVSAKRRLGVVVSILLLSFGLRVGGLDRPSILAPDELLFADRARRMVLQDDFFLTYAYTDKAPTTYLMIGASLGLVGEADFAVRLPNLYFSMLLLVSLYALAQRLFSNQIALWTVLLASLAPLEARYAVSGYQDIPMLALGILALWLAHRQKWAWAGLGLGLAVIMKPTGLWFMPLVVILGLWGRPHPASPTSSARKRKFVLKPQINLSKKNGWICGCASAQILRLLKMVIFFGIPILIVYLWDYGRPQHFYTLGSANNNPGRLIRADEVWPRLSTWLDILGEFSGGGWLSVILLGLGILALIFRLRQGGTESEGFLLLFLNFAVVYFAVQWLVAFNTYDRYMLILGPFFWILGGYGVNGLVQIADEYGNPLLHIPLIGMVLIGAGFRPTQQAATQDLAAYPTGIPELVNTLEADYHNRIVYDYWLNLELEWYLDPKAGVIIAYFSTPEELANHLATEHGERFFIAPSPEDAQFWIEILEAKGGQVKLVYSAEVGDYVIYSVLPPRSVLAEFFG